MIGLTISDVVAISRVLDQHGVTHLLAGGWGIDGLVGAQTRPHIDVDAVVLDADDTLRRAQTALAPLGYELIEQEADGGAWMPVTHVMRDAAGHLVELLPVDELPAAVRGSLDGTAVECLAPDVQLRFHAGYRPRASDRHDVGILQRKFGLTLPLDYTRAPLRRRVMDHAHEIVRWLRDQRPTALIIPVPEAHDVVAKWRQMYDPAAAAGIGPHITVLYPFMPERQVDDGVRDRLASIAANRAAFSFELPETGRFPGVLYLTPTPSDPFVELTKAVVAEWPDRQPYGGAFADVVPHLTIVGRESNEVDAIQAAVDRALPVTAVARELLLIVQQRNGQWSVAERFALAADSEVASLLPQRTEDESSASFGSSQAN